MESSSYSKTRSPARFLAAFLAVVMLFIFMPVMPVGAVNKAIKSVTFLDHPDDSSLETSSSIFAFFWDTYEETNVSSLSNSVTRWGGKTVDWKVSKESGNTDGFYKIKIYSEPASMVGLGKTFDFAGYVDDNYKVVYAGEEYAEDSEWKDVKYSNGVFSIPTMNGCGENVYIKVVKKPVTYNVTFSGIGSTEFHVEANSQVARDSSVLTVEEGKELNLKITGGPEGYEPKVFAGKNIEATEKTDYNSETGYSYKITVSSDLDVRISQVKKQFTVTMEFTAEGFTVGKPSGANFVDYGDEFSFTVTTLSGYNTPTVDITKGDADSKLAEGTEYDKSVNGSVTTYTIHSVKENINVEIGIATKQTYRLTFPNQTENGLKITYGDAEGSYDKSLSEGASITGLDYGKKLYFKIERLDGWSGNNPAVYANGAAVDLTPGEDNKYWTFEYEVEGNATFTISGFTRDTYTVVILPQAGVYTLVSSQQQAHYNDTVTFTMTLETGWKLVNPNSITLKTSGTGSVAIENKVSITHSTGNSYQITIEGIQKSLTLVPADGTFEKISYTVSDVTSSDKKYTLEFDAQNENGKVKHGEGLLFTVKPTRGYRISKVVYTPTSGIPQTVQSVDGDEVSDSKYSVLNVTSDGTITVTMTPITWKITFIFTESTKNIPGRDDSANSISSTVAYTVDSTTDATNKLVWDNDRQGYTLQLPVPTRKGWTYVGWENDEIALTKEIFYAGSDDRAITLKAEWAVNEVNGEDAFFFVQMLHFSFEGGITTFSAQIHTNLAQSDRDEVGAKLLDHGFLYASSKNELEKVTNLPQALQTMLQSLPAGANWYPDSNNQVIYYKRDDTDLNAELLGDGGGRFSLRMSNTEYGANYYAVAWVLVEIDEQIYLFISDAKQLEP